MSQTGTIIITAHRALRIPSDWFWELAAGDAGSSVFVRFANGTAYKVAAPVADPAGFIEDLVTTAVFVGSTMVLNARGLQAVNDPADAAQDAA